MNRYGLAIFLIAVPAAGAGEGRAAARAILNARPHSAVVVVLCEDGGRTPAGRLLERFGRVALDPVLRPFYRTRRWLVGAQATPAAFLEAVRGAGRVHGAVDVILFAHGMKGYIRLAGGRLTAEDLVRGLAGRRGERIRMVWTSACYSDSFLEAWKRVGAWAYRGVRGVNRPLDFPRFMIGWLSGADYGAASRAGFAANRAMHRLYNRHRAPVVAALRSARNLLRGWRPRTALGRALRGALLDVIRISLRWFHSSWDIEESRPVVRGGAARIDRLSRPRRHSAARFH